MYKNYDFINRKWNAYIFENRLKVIEAYRVEFFEYFSVGSLYLWFLHPYVTREEQIVVFIHLTKVADIYGRLRFLQEDANFVHFSSNMLFYFKLLKNSSAHAFLIFFCVCVFVYKKFCSKILNFFLYKKYFSWFIYSHLPEPITFYENQILHNICFHKLYYFSI